MSNTLQERNCLECNKPFLPTTQFHNLCTPVCREKFLDRPLAERKKILPPEDIQFVKPLPSVKPPR